MPRSVAISLAVWVAASPAMAARAAARSPQASLTAAIDQARTGDFFRAVLTLNDVVAQLSTRPEDSRLLARAHAYRALAYLGLEQPERAKTAVDQALKADPYIIVGVAEFGPRVVALFETARRPVASPDAEAAGQAAERASQFQDAFLAYLKAFQALPDPAPAADDRRLRERIITVVQKLGTKPLVPSEAQDHLKKADELVAANAVLGGSAGIGQQASVAELRQAVRIAPWWPEATLKLATVLQQAQRLDEALVNLNLYKLADPDGYTALERSKTTPSAGSAETSRPGDPAAVGAAVVYVYWLPTRRLFGLKSRITCDGHEVAELANGHFIRITAAPGIHTLDVKATGLSKKDLSSSFAAGQQHYVRVNVEAAPFSSAHFDLRMTSPDEAKAEMRDRKIAPNDPNKTYNAECK